MTMIIPPIKKTYAGQVVLDLPEMELPEGSIVVVRGTNGSGKSTFAKILAGIESADDKKKILENRTIGYMSQHTLAFSLSVRNNLMQNADPKRSRAENEARADLLLEQIGLAENARKNAKKLSGGQIQRMGLARILMKTYDVLILDEPTASMDRDAYPLAEDLIRTYQKETGGILILITHSEDQAKRMADSFLFLQDGKLTVSPFSQEASETHNNLPAHD